MRPGYKTTEFILTAIAVLLGALMTSGLLPEDSSYERVAGAVLAALASLGYAVSRGLAKAGGSEKHEDHSEGRRAA